MLHPVTGRTLCYNKTLAEVRETDPGAEVVNFDLAAVTLYVAAATKPVQTDWWSARQFLRVTI